MTMDTVFAPTYANLSMEYHETKLFNIEANCNLEVKQYFKENCIRVLGDCEVLLNTSYKTGQFLIL